MPSKEGWNLKTTHDKITLGKKQYRNMEEWERPCGVCGEKFSIYTRATAGHVNSSFGLKTCKEHRGQKIGGESALAFEQHEELERLRGWEEQFYLVLTSVQTKFPDATMVNIAERVNLLISAADQMHENYQSQFAELQECKARLAKYELPEMMKNMPWDN